MKIPTLDQWNSLPAGTYAIVTLEGEGRQWNVLKHDDEQDVTATSTRLVGPAVWAEMHGQIQSVELAYVPGGAPAFGPGPTLTMGELTKMLGKFNPDMVLRMRVGGMLTAPGRPFHHRSTEREVSLKLAAQRITVGEFLGQLSECRVLDREPFYPMTITPDLPVRIRDANFGDDDAWSITGAHVEGDKVYLDLA